MSKTDGPLKQAGEILIANSKEVVGLSSAENTRIALAQLENDKAEYSDDAAVFIETQKTYRQELATGSPYARNWRPTLGYIIAITFGIQMLSMTWAIIAEPELSAGIISSFGVLFPMWIMGFAAMGINIKSRSNDKFLQMHANNGTAPNSPPTSLLSKLADSYTDRNPRNQK